MKKLLPAFLLMLAICTSYHAQASEDDKPFAEKRVVLQISDNDPSKQTLVLNVAGNLIKAYGPDKVDVEIVAFGPGLRLMFNDNHNKGRISSLVDNGVRFAACDNTIQKMTQILGSKPELNTNAKVVPGGVARILDLASDGYTIIKP